MGSREGELPPQPWHFARSQLSSRPSALVTVFCLGIAWQLWETDGYNCGQITGKEGTEDGNGDSIEELRDEGE